MLKSCLLVLVLTGAAALGQSAFDGTWTLDMQSAQFKDTHKMLLKDGQYDCYTCDPVVKGFKADGQPHSAPGSPYYDTVSVRAVDDHTVEIFATKNGKPTGTAKESVSADGKTLTTQHTFTSENGEQNTETDVWERIADAPAGANKISGTWRQAKVENASKGLTTVTFKVTADGIAMKDGTGDSYDAKFDGKDYPYHGDPGINGVSVKKIDANTIEETDKRDGKVMSVSRMTVQSDGKTMKITSEDTVRHNTSEVTASKQ